MCASRCFLEKNACGELEVLCLRKYVYEALVWAIHS